MLNIELFNQDAILINALKVLLGEVFNFENIDIKEGSTYLSFSLRIPIDTKTGFCFKFINGMDVHTINQVQGTMFLYGKIKGCNYYDLAIELMKTFLQRQVKATQYYSEIDLKLMSAM